jgi:uroporphyrinogen-III synthase
MPALSGVTVVVTRPAHQADNLCQLIEAAGGQVLRFPVIDIQPTADSRTCHAQLQRLAEFDLAIFISANAVDVTLEQLTLTLQQTWPSDLPIASVGKATAHSLVSKGLQVTHIAPEPYNSEALLSMPELQNLDGKRIVIIRGEGGREYLRDRLMQRGAEVEYVECYRRAVATADTQQLYAAWEKTKISNMPIVVTSNQGLKNLLAMIDEEHQPILLASTLMLISERTARLSRELTFSQTPVIAAAANDDAILDGLKTWAKN